VSQAPTLLAPALTPESKASILLVDDNPANLLSLRALLDSVGQDLVDAHSGEQALELVQAREFAVVLLDVLMPGIDGFETAHRIRASERSRRTPIIFLTSGDMERWQIEKGYGLGAVDFLLKPLMPVVLQAKVRGFLELFLDKDRARREAEQLRLLIDGTTEYAIFMLDPEGRIVTWNTGAERLKGYKAEDIIGRHFSRFYPQEANERGWPQHELKMARKEGRFEDEGWRLRKDGSRFWANVVITALRDEQGNLRGFSKITRDMTERKKAEMNARRLAEETTARRVAEENARVIQEQKEQRKRSEQAARFLAQASATLSVLIDFESTLQKVAALAVPSFADWTAVDLVQDDDSLKRVAVAHIDPSKVALAHALHKRFPPDPEAPRGIGHILRTGKAELTSDITDELLAEAVKDEELLAILHELGLKSYIGVPLKVRGKTLGVISFISAESGHRYDATDLAVAQDLADRGAIAIENAQLYRELRDADRRKDEFLATLAHELRNPLAPIRNSLQILKLPRLDAATAQQAREMMERQVHHLVRLVDDLLDVSRVMRGKIDLRKETMELATIVARALETAKPLIEVQGHELDFSLPEESLLLHADPVRLAQVVGNLLTNAAKYTEPNGRIWLSAWREGDQAVLNVRDSGIGIEPDVLPHIFELFVQADHASTKAQGGLGIGLTLVKNLVEMHGGRVEAHSPGLGKGSEFVVRLPLMVQASDEASARRNGHHGPPKAGSGHRLLVVDDNYDAATSLLMLLKLQDHDVRVAHDGPTALEIAATFRPDLVLLDIGMPIMDGYEVATRLRKIPGLESIVIVALTGWGQREDRRRSAEAGFDHHLIKPLEPKMLESLISELNLAKEHAAT